MSANIRMVCAERLLADRQRALEEPLGIGIFALLRGHDGQTDERVGHIGVVLIERLLVGR
jgi:hypothetical protein